MKKYKKRGKHIHTTFQTIKYTAPHLLHPGQSNVLIILVKLLGKWRGGDIATDSTEKYAIRVNFPVNKRLCTSSCS
jgi:hypothetical protein